MFENVCVIRKVNKKKKKTQENEEDLSKSELNKCFYYSPRLVSEFNVNFPLLRIKKNERVFIHGSF